MSSPEFDKLIEILSLIWFTVLMFDPLSEHGYTGRVWYGNITYILDNPLYCKKGLVIMSIEEDNTVF